MDYPDYDPTLQTPPLSDPELDELDSLLRSLPGEQAMNVEGLDGYLSALVVGPLAPQTLKAARWMPPVWGGDGEGAAPFPSQKQRKKAIVAVLRHLHSIDRQLHEAPDEWEPVVSVAETADGEQVDAEDWCIGFLQAVALDPEAWAPLFDDPALGPLLVPIALLGGDEAGLAPADAARLADPEARDALSREAIDAVAALGRRTRPG